MPRFGLKIAPILLALLSMAALAAPSQAKDSCVLTIAAASDLTYAMNDIAAGFKKVNPCEVRVSYGSSGNFLTQIENGAPFDVFFSADVDYPRKLESEGFADPGTEYVYATGKLILWVPNGSSLDPAKGLAILSDPAVKKISIANPEHAPYGRAAVEALRAAGVYDSVKDRLVLGENISQAAQFAESGNADAGILALSLALSPELNGKGRYAPVPEKLYKPIQQAAVILRVSKNAQEARAFLNYVKTPAASAVLARYGFARGAAPAKGQP